MNRLCIQTSKRLQNHHSTETSNFPFSTISPLPHNTPFVFVLLFCSSFSARRVPKKVVFTPRTFCCVPPAVEFFLDPFVSLFWWIPPIAPYLEFRILQLLSSPLICTTNSRFPSLHPAPVPSLLCLRCDHTCLVLWCLYVVSLFLPTPYLPRRVAHFPVESVDHFTPVILPP